jgi:hypothetical protein
LDAITGDYRANAALRSAVPGLCAEPWTYSHPVRVLRTPPAGAGGLPAPNIRATRDWIAGASDQAVARTAERHPGLDRRNC